MDLLQNFRDKQIIMQQIECPDELKIWLDHCEYAIHTQFDKGSKQTYKFKKRKKQINPNLRNAIQNLNREQKVEFYLRMVTHLQNLYKGKQEPPKVSQVDKKPIQGQCECRSFNLKIWKLKRIRLDRSRHEIMVQNEKDNKIKTYELRNYLLRKSKMKDRHTLVLQAINDKPHQKSRTVHIAFRDQQSLRKWFQMIKQQVEYSQWLNVKDMFTQSKINSSVVTEFKVLDNNSTQQKSANLKSSKASSASSSFQKKRSDVSHSQIDEDKIFRAEDELQKDEGKMMNRNTFIDHLVNDDCANFQQFFEEIDNQTEKDVQQKKNLDFFHKLMPEYELDELAQLSGYQTLVNEQQKFQILQNIDNSYRFKLILTFDSSIFSAKQIFCLISDPKNALQINENIEQESIKTLLKSENSAIMYRTLKAFNKFYRLRDFIFIRHSFAHKNNVYLIDKSIDNINFPPFMTLVRGEMSILWGIIKDEKTKQLKLFGDFIIVNSGLLNNQQQTNLSLKYLNGFKLLLKKEPENEIQSYMFDINWNIDKKDQNKKTEELRVRRKTIQMQKQKLKSEQIHKSNNNNINNKPTNFTKKQSIYVINNALSPEKKESNQNEVHEVMQVVSEKPILIVQSPAKKKEFNQFYTEIQVIRKLDKEGFVIVDKKIIKNKYVLKPIQKQPYKDVPKVKGHAIWRGDWLHDTKNGGIIFINQKKIQDQKGVLKFVLTKIGKNILSGKSVLNISLPVDIFTAQSNLERLFISMGYGPKLLQNMNQKSSLQKLAKTVAFGVSNSVLYLNMEKPFNPILGETFQCWINGCPGYGQQISHHPPIAALMFFGRGYRVTCQLQSKVQLHMNSGCGINEGIYKVLFDDGTQICFMTPGGEISGLTYGDRKFNLVGRSYYWIQKQRIFVELNYQAGKKGFFSKQQKPCDFFEGKIYQVLPQFFTVFPKSKKREPTQKQRVKQLGKFEGIWNKYVKFNNEQILNLDSQVPIRIQYQAAPLHSDSNWREDIQYRRLNKTTKAQSQKQRLEVLQRNDRKFRAKYHKH